jgi:hypothetical protein
MMKKQPDNLESMTLIMDAIMKSTAAVFGKTVGVALVVYDGGNTKGPSVEYYSNMQSEVLGSVLSMVTTSVVEDTQPLPIIGTC